MQCQDGDVKPPLMEQQRLNIRLSPHPDADTWLLIGALGAGMQAFADMLLDAGESVAGIDQDMTTNVSATEANSELRRFKILPTDGVDQLLATAPGHVVYSTAVPDSSPLLQRLRLHNLNLMSLPAALSHFLQ